MGERTDLPKIKPDEQPSIINTEAGTWGFSAGIGAALASFPYVMSREVRTALKKPLSDREFVKIAEKNLPNVKKAAIVIVAAELVGALLGGLAGKQKQEQEQSDGRTVKTPSYWNAGILGGLFVTGVVPDIMRTFRLNRKTTLEATKTLAEELKYSTGKGSSWPLVIPLAGAVIGSILRKNSLQRDFDKAVALRDANHAKTQQLLEAVAANQQAAQTPAADEVSFKNSVTADEAAALLEKQAQAPAPTIEKPAHGPQHTGHADKHTPATSHTGSCLKPEAERGMAMSA